MIDQKLADELKERARGGDSSVIRSRDLKALFDQLKSMPPADRSKLGQALNELKIELTQLLTTARNVTESLPPIDVSAPFDVNIPIDKRPRLLPAEYGSQHPLMTELESVLDIFYRMGFTANESREIDDDFHMFGSLNFPEGHPARDDYDTFMTIQKDSNKRQFIAPAHTSTMQNRVLKSHKADLEAGQPIAVVIPGRVFRNEDVDARHEHTFYQLEGVYVDKGVNSGHLIATLKTFLQTYFGKQLEVKTNPFYFPFTEPSFEFMISCPFCDKKGCQVCGYQGWIEILGCGMIHPNVLHAAGIDTNIYTGFAWGGGIERLVMKKYNIEDIRHFESGRLEFLRQFK
ncbi:MAG TPA: phenylalanine--tRNA ligase subunit alpha [Candidatus Saccharimonadales bacterium]|nr:phenylalanine--tRNA ligase subunit alpha [Candidatus Saccharimonadales bacterium]